MSECGSSRRFTCHRLAQWLTVLLVIVAVDQLLVWAYQRHATNIYSVVPPSIADAAVVLFSALDADGSLDAETRRRLDHAVFLYRRGTVRSVLCSGGARASAGRQGANLMVDYLRDSDMPPGNIHAEQRSFDTSTNVEQSLAFARRRGWTSLVFVSSPVHLLRVRFFAQGEGRPVMFSAYTASDASTAPGWSESTNQAHHEWIAWAGYALLPRAEYRTLVARWRGAVPAANPEAKPASSAR